MNASMTWQKKNLWKYTVNIPLSHTNISKPITQMSDRRKYEYYAKCNSITGWFLLTVKYGVSNKISNMCGMHVYMYVFLFKLKSLVIQSCSSCMHVNIFMPQKINFISFHFCTRKLLFFCIQGFCTKSYLVIVAPLMLGVWRPPL